MVLRRRRGLKLLSAAQVLVLLNWGLGWRFFCNAAIYMVGSLLAMMLTQRMLALEACTEGETVYDVVGAPARSRSREQGTILPGFSSETNCTQPAPRPQRDAGSALERLDIDACRAASSVRIRALALVYKADHEEP